MDISSQITLIDQVTNDFKNTFGKLSSLQLNQQPGENTWSIAQNIEHLIVINESYYPIINSLRNGTYKKPFMARFGFMVRFIGRSILKSVQPDRRRKMKTFGIWQPGQSRVEENILEKFVSHQEALKNLINESQDLVKKGTIISSPANKNIVYTLETAFDIIIAHEQRHLVQSKEAAATLHLL